MEKPPPPPPQFVKVGAPFWLCALVLVTGWFGVGVFLVAAFMGER